MTAGRPLPKVGDRVVMRWQPENPNNWWRPGIVRAVIDDEVIIVRRETRRGLTYEPITAQQWRIYDPARTDFGGEGGLHLIKRRRRPGVVLRTRKQA